MKLSIYFLAAAAAFTSRSAALFRTSQSIDQIEDTHSARDAITNEAVNSRRSITQTPAFQSLVNGIINNTLANAALHVSSATFDTPNNQIELSISSIINSTLAESALNIGGTNRNGSNLAPNTHSPQNQDMDHANDIIIEAAIEAASTLFKIPKSNVKFVKYTSNTAAGTATNGSSHVESANIILNTTVNAAVNAASTVFNIPKGHIKVVDATDNTAALGIAKAPTSSSITVNSQVKATNSTDNRIANTAAKALSAIAP